MEKGETLPLVFTCQTGSGTYTKAVSVTVGLPWVINPGIKTVPVMSPVLLLAKCGQSIVNGEWTPCTQPSFSWSITSSPTGSTASLTDATTRSPWFTPDKVGTYTIQETNGSGASIDVHAGRYHGVIDPILTLDSLVYGDGRPVADQNCTSCHAVGSAAPANFDTWRLTGHGEAFTQNITSNAHFGESCFACHTVGFGRTSGIDDTPDYQDFVDNALGTATPDTWINMLINDPDTARLSNIQCENCHGPQDYTQAHKDQPGAPRVSLGAEVCGSCHGEPARHGRFQQWQLSNHADYDLARSRGASSGNCARCHSGNGFVAWSKLDFDPNQQVTLTWDQDTVVPQTCATCHNPHDEGTTSGGPETDAKVRVMGNTHQLVAGFTAIGVGKGATCMTCHNSRTGDGVLRNDNTWSTQTDAQRTLRPHHGVQADEIMGQNVYFVTPGIRGKHSFIEDVCVTCHMEKTLPPAILSYNQTGTNHTFAADPNICAECHGAGGITANTVQTVVSGYLDLLQTALGDAYKQMMVDNYPVTIGGCTDVVTSSTAVADGTNPITSVAWKRTDQLDITLQDGTLCSNRNPNTITGSNVINTNAGTLYSLSLANNNGAPLRAAWNWSLFNEDEGKGVHNPQLALEGLQGAISAVSNGNVNVNSVNVALPTSFGVVDAVSK